MMDAFICDAIRTPIGRFGGALSSIRADDLAALSIKELKEKNTSIDWSMVDEVIFGCANQSGEDNRNIARMSLLLAGLPQTVPGITINRLCASGLEAVTYASRMIKSNEAHLIIAGGVESMSRAPFVIPKSTTPFSRNAEIYDTTIGWRFINPIMRQMYGVDSMPETAENVAERWNISREDQDKFAYWSQKKAAEAISKGRFDTEIFKVKIIQKKEENFLDKDEHPRSDTLLEKLSTLPTPFRINGSVTAGNASGVNDGSAALIIASEKAIKDLDKSGLSILEISHRSQKFSEIISKAKANLEVDGEKIVCEGEGNGPVHALDNAIRNNVNKLEKYAEYLKDLKLVDYKVRILNTGTEATTRVSIESTDSQGKNWFTIGVSPNIIDASFKALIDSLDYKLFKDKAPASL